MPVALNIEHPEDNTIDLDPEFLDHSNGTVTVLGHGNRLVVEKPLVPNRASFVLGGGATIILGMDSNVNDLHVHASDGAYIEIGPWSSFNIQCLISAHEQSTVLIGKHCLFGSQTRIASSDVHKVVDRHTRVRLNPAGDIIIGERVWVAPNCLILRNTIIGCGSVVGTGAIVRDEFPAYVLLAGTPARIVRENVTWEF